jgi:hypothetical protein
MTPASDATVGQRERAPDPDAVSAGGPAAAGAAGALAGATAGLATGIAGPIGALVGLIVGALGGAAVGAAGAQATVQELYTDEFDAHYRRAWEGRPGRTADMNFERVRPAYQFGHIAAQRPEYAGRYFADIEPELRSRWPDELRTHVGEWEAARPFVEDAFGYARNRGLGVRRDTGVIGSAGSAVDPVERDRSRAGLPSVDEPPRDASGA